MKKVFITVTVAAVMAAVAMSASACTFNLSGGKGGNGTTYTVYAPDGAPALALASFINEASSAEADLVYDYDFHVVAASTITAQVTGETPAADFCVLPVNIAANVLGTGESYKMLGTVTNGNMFFLTTGENPMLTEANLSTLVGKTVGVVQLQNVPGLTFQSVLMEKGIPYQILGNDTAINAEKVNLRAFADASTVTPAAGCDYYLCPEPAVSTKLANVPAFKLGGNLQELHAGGYPQAVLVAKNSVKAAAIREVMAQFEGSANYLKNAAPAEVLSLLDGARSPDLTPSFNAANLTVSVIENCSVRFTASAACKAAVNAFLEELIAVNPQFTKTVSDKFYY